VWPSSFPFRYLQLFGAPFAQASLCFSSLLLLYQDSSQGFFHFSGGGGCFRSPSVVQRWIFCVSSCEFGLSVVIVRRFLSDFSGGGCFSSQSVVQCWNFRVPGLRNWLLFVISTAFSQVFDL
jgi:hypothetical protein